MLRFVRAFHPEEQRVWLVLDEWGTRKGRAMWLTSHHDIVQQCVKTNLASTIFRERVFVRPDMASHVRVRLCHYAVTQLRDLRDRSLSVPADAVLHGSLRSHDTPSVILLRDASPCPPIMPAMPAQKRATQYHLHDDFASMARDCAVVSQTGPHRVPLLALQPDMAAALSGVDGELVSSLFGGEGGDARAILIPGAELAAAVQLIATLTRLVGFVRIKT